MAETVTVPGMGAVKKQHLLAGAGVVAGIVGFAWWRRNSLGGGGGDAPVYDTSELVPETDYTSPGSNSNIPPQNPAGVVLTTNGEWSKAAIQYLTEIGGYESRMVIDAMGVYFQRGELTPSQMSAVMAAIAVLGPPPVNGPWPLKPIGPAPNPPPARQRKSAPVARRAS